MAVHFENVDNSFEEQEIKIYPAFSILFIRL